MDCERLVIQESHPSIRKELGLATLVVGVSRNLTKNIEFVQQTTYLLSERTSYSKTRKRVCFETDIM